MKKFFIALSVLAALMLSVVPSQALIGVPDVDALGVDAIVPFITELDYTGKTGLNTLIIFVDAKGVCTTTGGTTAQPKDFHYTVYTVRSKTVYDNDLDCTPYDIVSTDGYTILGQMAPDSRSDLEVDLDGDGTNDHYAGYIWFDKSTNVTSNGIGGQFIFVNLAKGVAASSNIPMKEYHADYTLGTQAAAYSTAMLATDQTELFSIGAFQAAIDRQDGRIDTAPRAATSFGIYPRYYIAASGDETWLLYWQSSNGISGTTARPAFHIDWYDDEENDASSNITINDEFTIIDVEGKIPESLFSASTYKKEGWINLTWTPSATYLDQAREFLGWTFIQAFGTIGSQNTSWGIINPMWRWVAPGYAAP